MPNSASYPNSTAVPTRSGSPHIMPCMSLVYIYIYLGEPERDPHDEVYGFFFCLSVGTFAFRIYSCSNSTITQYFSHTLCVRVDTCACREFDEYEVHGLHLRTRINQSHRRSL